MGVSPLSRKLFAVSLVLILFAWLIGWMLPAVVAYVVLWGAAVVQDRSLRRRVS